MQRVVNVRHHTGSRPKVEGRRAAVLLMGPLQCGVVPPAWGRHGFDVRPTCPPCGVPCLACLVGAMGEQRVLALLLLAGAGCLLESPAAVPASLCASRHLKIRRQIVPSSHLSVKQAKKINLRKGGSDLATPKEASSHFDSGGII